MKQKILVGLFIFSAALTSGVVFSQTAMAATPPDNCFNFDIPTNTIVDYYDNEDDNPANSACPKDVDIPTSIGGATVTTIGQFSFRSKQLTSLTIPNSVTSIGANAFEGNQLTSVIIPSSVTSIGFFAFLTNQLTSVTIPNSVTTLGGGAFMDNKLTSVTLGTGLSSLANGVLAYNLLTEVQLPSSITSIDPGAFEFQAPNAYARLQASDYSVLQDVWYARVYTADPSNPANLQDGQPQLVPESLLGADLNGDGDQADTFSSGGHLINPAQVTISYRDSGGNTLRPSMTHTGVGLGTYRAAENEAADLSSYFRIGNNRSFSAPVIAGYNAITPASPYAMTLAAADGNNSLAFIYTAAQGGNSGTDGSSQQTPLAPDAGVQPQNGLSITLVLSLALGIALAVARVALTVKRRL